MDLKAVKEASRRELVACAAAAAENARDLLGDAELLSDADRHPRAYSLAVLAVEEYGKAVSLLTLAVMPENLRAQAPVRRMLECHPMKQVGGLLLAVLPPSELGPAASLAAMPLTQLTHVLDTMDAFVQDADRLKLRGLYVDMQRNARIRRPSEITEAEVSDEIGCVRQVASSAGLLCDSGVVARLADPPAEAIELARALVSALAESGENCSPDTAAAITLKAVRGLKEHLAAAAKPTTPAGPRRP
jgi:AbiV family abortive infection protein